MIHKRGRCAPVEREKRRESTLCHVVFLPYTTWCATPPPPRATSQSSASPRCAPQITGIFTLENIKTEQTSSRAILCEKPDTTSFDVGSHLWHVRCGNPAVQLSPMRKVCGYFRRLTVLMLELVLPLGKRTRTGECQVPTGTHGVTPGTE